MWPLLKEGSENQLLLAITGPPQNTKFMFSFPAERIVFHFLVAVLHLLTSKTEPP